MTRSTFQIALAISIGFATASHAQDSIYEKCVAAIAAGLSDEVAEMSATIMRFSSHPSASAEAAEACVSAGLGAPMRWDSRSGKFIPAEDFERSIQERQKTRQAGEDRERARRASALLREVQERRRQQNNEALIAAGTYRACSALFERDEIATMTNALCVQSFRKYGHPDLDQ